MIRLQVLYHHPKDPVAFDRYYYQVHLPIAKKISGFNNTAAGSNVQARGICSAGIAPSKWIR